MLSQEGPSFCMTLWSTNALGQTAQELQVERGFGSVYIRCFEESHLILGTHNKTLGSARLLCGHKDQRGTHSMNAFKGREWVYNLYLHYIHIQPVLNYWLEKASSMTLVAILYLLDSLMRLFCNTHCSFWNTEEAASLCPVKFLILYGKDIVRPPAFPRFTMACNQTVWPNGFATHQTM